MENQTRFDLNAAVENWRQELAAQPPLTPDNRRELETHLRDALAELKTRGLSDEESFWLARRRVGQPQKLGEEFANADPARVWRERVFWMWLALFLSCTLGSWGNSLALAVMPTTFHGSFFVALQITQITFLVISVFIPLILAISLARGKWVSHFSKLMRLMEQRWRLAWAVAVCVVLSSLFRFVGLELYYSRMNAPHPPAIVPVISPVLYSLVAGLLLIWLASPEKRKSPKNI